MVDSDELATGCSEGLFEKLDWSAIGGKDHYLPQAVSDCGVGAGLASLVLAWDRDKFPATPGWADFWDVAKYPGKRGLHRGVRGNLEFALFADGVSPADVYKVLATSEGVDRAFRRLDQLKTLHRVVAGRCRGGAHPGVRRCADDQRLGTGDRRRRTGPRIAISACSGRRASTRWRAGRF